MTMSSRVVVVGGGVVGTACAHFLNAAGCEVTILESRRHGSGCSHGNCGYICPSHVLPLTTPAALKEAWRSLFNRNAPFRVQFRLSPTLWRFFWEFGRRCYGSGRLKAATGLQNLLLSSMSLYEELLSEGLECEWQKKGLLYVYASKSRLDAFDATNALMRDRFNEPAEKIDAAALESMEPALKPGLAGAWYYEHDAHVRPDRLMSSWRRMLESRGVSIREECAMTGLVTHSNRASAVQTNVGEIEADAVVVATGSWTPQLAGMLGCRLPIQPGKGYSITMPRPEVCPQYPMIFPETRVAVTPWESGYRLGSTMEFAGYDTSIRPERIQLLKDGAAPYLREAWREPIEEEWYGWRPMTWDSLPIIGALPRLGNVFVAAGHNMIGMSMATGTGKLVSELVLGRPPHIDPTPYSVSRF